MPKKCQGKTLRINLIYSNTREWPFQAFFPFDDGQFLEGRKPLYLKYAVIIEQQGNFHHRYFFTDLAQTRTVKAVEKWRCSHET